MNETDDDTVGDTHRALHYVAVALVARNEALDRLSRKLEEEKARADKAEATSEKLRTQLGDQSRAYQALQEELSATKNVLATLRRDHDSLLQERVESVAELMKRSAELKRAVTTAHNYARANAALVSRIKHLRLNGVDTSTATSKARKRKVAT